MTAVELLNLTLIAANNIAAYQAIALKMQAEGRTDLTPEEVAQVRAIAVGAQDALQVKIDAARA